MARTGKAFTAFTSFDLSADALAEANTESSAPNRVLRGVTIIRSGLGNKRDRHLYTPKAMKEAVSEGLFNDLRAFVDHPTTVDEQVQPERSVRDVAGVYKNPKFIEASGGQPARVVADLHVLKPHAWLAEGVRELVELGCGDRIGISILGSGKTTPDKYREGDQEYDVARVDKFTHLKSADIVTQAGAGGGFQNLLESARADYQGATMKANCKETLTKISEAAADGDVAEVKKLSATLEECGCSEGKVEEKKTKADDADAEDEADGGDDEDTENADGSKKTEKVAEATKKVATSSATPAAGNTKGLVKKAPNATAGRKVPFGESDKTALKTKAKTKTDTTIAEDGDGGPDGDGDELAQLREQNATLQAAIRANDIGKYASKKLRESGLPLKTRHALFAKLMSVDPSDALTEAEIDSEIAFTVALSADMKESALSEFDDIEGAGGSAHETTGGTTVDSLKESILGTGLKLKKPRTA